jgi:transcriptional regulator with XRE-family HTH domain
METKNKAPHLGRKIGRIREMLGVKQETLAEKLGISQQAVSKIEQSEQVEDTTLVSIIFRIIMTQLRITRALTTTVQLTQSTSGLKPWKKTRSFMRLF